MIDVRGPSRLDPALVHWMAEQLRPLWWHKAAVCRGADPALFFIDRGKSSAAAKQLCAECPVPNACLDWALEESIDHGIFGGMSVRERRSEKRRRRLAARVA